MAPLLQPVISNHTPEVDEHLTKLEQQSHVKGCSCPGSDYVSHLQNGSSE